MIISKLQNMNGIWNPQDEEMEEAVVGACLIESEAMPLIAGKIGPEVFYNETNRLIFSTMLSMNHRGLPIDILTVKSELAARGKLEAAGGAYNVTRLSGRVASGAHLEYHVAILKELYIRREAILGSHKQLAAASDQSVDIADILVGMHNLLDRLAEDGRLGIDRADLQRIFDSNSSATGMADAQVEAFRSMVKEVTDRFPDGAGYQPGDIL